MKMKTIVVLLFFAVAIFGIMAPINAVESSISSENKIYSIESKKKAVNLKITWNANGGKLGSKKTTVTTVKKGSKLNKLLATPKRSGYSFNGWYTKKTGGKKITKNTKPSKSVTYYAQWKKGSSRVLNSEEKKLVGTWGNEYDGFMRFTFYADGTYIGLIRFKSHDFGTKGNYSLKNGIFTREYYYSYNYPRPFGNNYSKGWGPWTYETSKMEGDRGVIFSTINGKPAFTFGLYRMNGEWFIKDRVPPFTLDGFPRDYFS